MEARYLNQQDTDPMAANMEAYKSAIQTLDASQVTQVINDIESEWNFSARGNKWIPLKIGFKIFCRTDQLDEDDMPKSVDLEAIVGIYRNRQSI